MHLTGALEVDLEQRDPTAGEGLLDRASGRAVAPLLVYDRPFQELPLRHHPVELRVGDEPVVHAVLFPRSRRARRRRDRDPDLGMVGADVG